VTVTSRGLGLRVPGLPVWQARAGGRAPGTRDDRRDSDRDESDLSESSQSRELGHRLGIQ
jgi:hypothetical protein